MRVECPGGNWIDLRGADELTGADDDAWHGVYYKALSQAAEVSAEEDDGKQDDGMEMSPDGVSMTPKRRRLRLPPDIIQQQRDALLGSIITGWSYDLPLPYTRASRATLPLPACKAVDHAIEPHIALIKDSGPKENPSGSSANGSADASPTPQTDSPTPSPSTASP